MAKRIKASALRENIDRILDQVAATGVPVEIEWQGQLLMLSIRVMLTAPLAGQRK